jgi:hypothetical protein
VQHCAELNKTSYMLTIEQLFYGVTGVRKWRGRIWVVVVGGEAQTIVQIKTKLRGFCPHANYTDRATAAFRRS